MMSFIFPNPNNSPPWTHAASPGDLPSPTLTPPSPMDSSYLPSHTHLPQPSPPSPLNAVLGESAPKKQKLTILSFLVLVVRFPPQFIKISILPVNMIWDDTFNLQSSFFNLKSSIFNLHPTTHPTNTLPALSIISQPIAGHCTADATDRLSGKWLNWRRNAFCRF